jgi:hypothetical protein
MGIEVSRLGDEPIITATILDSADFRADVPAMLARIVELRDNLAGQPACYYVILDLSRYSLSFSDLVFALGEVRGVRNLRRDDLPAHVMVVGLGGMIELGASSLAQLQYGAYPARLFASLDEALSAARDEIAAG